MTNAEAKRRSDLAENSIGYCLNDYIHPVYGHIPCDQCTLKLEQRIENV